jgi:large subunit ribosomal protein L28
MAKVCPITGKKAMSGHNVSHSQRHTKRKFQPNLVKVTLVDEQGRKKRMRVSAKALRTMDKSPRTK